MLIIRLKRIWRCDERDCVIGAWSETHDLIASRTAASTSFHWLMLQGERFMGSDRGARSAFRLVGFPGPSSEPDVRLSLHPAPHVFSTTELGTRMTARKTVALLHRCERRNDRNEVGELRGAQSDLLAELHVAPVIVDDRRMLDPSSVWRYAGVGR